MKETFDPNKIKSDFIVHNTLNPKFWKDNTLIPSIRKRLLVIANSFIKTLDRPIKIKDVTFTGSLANFNYSDLSDVDLHIVIDYSDISPDLKLVEEFLALKKNSWNEAHNIKLFGHPVEVYVEDEKTPHITTGLFSLISNKWVKEPTSEQPIFDPEDVATKANHFKSLYNSLVKQFNKKRYKFVISQIATIKDQIKTMRRAGLATGGQYSIENLAFKVLRRSGILNKFTILKNKATDKSLGD